MITTQNVGNAPEERPIGFYKEIVRRKNLENLNKDLFNYIRFNNIKKATEVYNKINFKMSN
ncbi:MAG: hypothetical protein ACOC1O_01415 [bacterium]